MMLKKTILVFILIIHLSTSFSQKIDKKKLDSYFKILDSNHKFMGSIALSKNGKIVYSNQIGFKHVHTKSKADINTIYLIGSISKTYTAVLIFKAIEEGKLRLNDSLKTFYPSIKKSEKITIDQLLSHRSGIGNFTSNFDFKTWHFKPHTEQEMIDKIIRYGTVFEPNSKAEYSNSNYVLLSFILEKIYSKSYEKILEEKLIIPLHLSRTSAGKKLDSTKNEAISYKFNSGWVFERETDMSVPKGAGNVSSTPTDILKFADALFNGKIISKEHLELMKNQRDEYGMGLFQYPFYEKKIYGHSGGIDGFTSMFEYYPEEKIGYALTSNGTNYDNNKINIAALSAIFNKPYDLPNFKKQSLKTEELDQYLGEYHNSQAMMTIHITKNDRILIAQAVGQPAFNLEPAEKHVFTFEFGGVVLEFNPPKSFILKQGGQVIEFKKD